MGAVEIDDQRCQTLQTAESSQQTAGYYLICHSPSSGDFTVRTVASVRSGYRGGWGVRTLLCSERKGNGNPGSASFAI